MGGNSNTQILIKLLSRLCVILGSCPQALLLDMLTRCFVVSLHMYCVFFAPSAKSHVCACSFFRKTLLTKSVCTGLQQTRKQQLAQQRGPERVASARSAMRSWLTPRQLSEARQALSQNGYGLNECERVLKFPMNLIWVMCYLVHCG